MLSESVKLALYDIRDNILLAGEFVGGLTNQQFSESRLHLYAVMPTKRFVPFGRSDSGEP